MLNKYLWNELVSEHLLCARERDTKMINICFLSPLSEKLTVCWKWWSSSLGSSNHGSQPGAVLLPKGHLLMSGPIFDCYKLGDATGIR